MQKHIDICSRNDRDLINPYVLNILVAQEKNHRTWIQIASTPVL